MIKKQDIKEDIDMFFHASMSALCHCYDHTEGFYPDSCGCDQREAVSESIRLLVEEHRRIVRKHDL
jgi:hypothetical protein